MSPFISTSAPQTTSCSCFLAMPGGLSSSLASKGQMKLTTTVLVILLSVVVLLASSCEARGLRVHGKGSSSKQPHLPASKDVERLKVDGWLTRQQADARTMVDNTAIDDHLTRPDSKMEDIRPVVKVSQRLFQREDTGFHLDYAGPRTHPPSHN